MGNILETLSVENGVVNQMLDPHPLSQTNHNKPLCQFVRYDRIQKINLVDPRESVLDRCRIQQVAHDDFHLGWELCGFVFIAYQSADMYILVLKRVDDLGTDCAC